MGHEGLVFYLFLAESMTETLMSREVGEAISDIAHFDKTAARDLMMSDECQDPLTIAVLAMFVGNMLPTHH